MRKQLLKLTMLIIVATMLPGRVIGQNIADIGKGDPLIVTGTLGTMNTYRNSSVGNGYGSPLSNTVYANLNISLYGLSMPFSLYYSNDNLDFNYPKLSFHINPTYKNWRGHFGLSSMSMSNYVMNMSFNGIGLEYNSDKIRGGFFYGRLRNAINDDPTDPFARAPQYKRMGWGMKAGYGSGKNYVDVYFLRAYDQISSLDEGWRQFVRPQENIVVGVKGCVTPVKWFSLTTNAAASVFNKDKEAPKIATTTDFDKIFDTRYSSLARFAGDVNANFMFGGLNASVSYRMVQPDYTSLGAYYMSNNYHSLSVSASTHLFKKIALTGTFSGQADNLSNEQMFTTCGYIYAFSASTRIGQLFNISAGYNGYQQMQRDGTCQVIDSIKVHRIMHSFNVMPSFAYDGTLLGHSASLSFNYSRNEDLNKFATGISDVTTKAVGVSYNMEVKPWEIDITASISHQESKGYQTKYRSDVASLGTSRSFLEQKNLNIGANLSLCYNEVERQSKALSLAADFSASYNLKKVHVFSATAGFSKYGDVNVRQTRSNLDCTDINVTFNYVYTFSLISILKKDKNKDGATL